MSRHFHAEEFESRALDGQHRASNWAIASVLLWMSCMVGCSPSSDQSSHVPAAQTGVASSTQIVNATVNTEPSSRTTTTTRDRVAATLQYNLENRLLSAERNAAWQVLHGLVAYGAELPLEVNGKKVLALDYLLNGGELQGWELYPGTPLKDGRLGVRARLEAGGYRHQGHVDQWIGYLAQIDVPIDRKLMVAGREHTFADWIDQALLDVTQNPLDEYSWTLAAATYYRPDQQTWTAIDSTEVDIDTLVAFEAEQDLNESACGGSHRLMGLARAVKYAQRNNITDRPAFQTAAKTVQQALATMQRFQNSDGSLSANYFQRPGTSADLSLMISATGHQIEVAAYALDDQEISALWLERAVIRFCEMLEATKDQALECGGLYHGLKGLRIYFDRRFAPDMH